MLVARAVPEAGSSLLCYAEDGGIDPLAVCVQVDDLLQTASGAFWYEMARNLRVGGKLRLDDSVLNVVNVSSVSRLIYSTIAIFRQMDGLENGGEFGGPIT